MLLTVMLSFNVEFKIRLSKTLKTMYVHDSKLFSNLYKNFILYGST